MMNSTKHRLLATLITCTLSYHANATMDESSRFKVAVIKNAPGSKLMTEGKFERSTEQLLASISKEPISFEQALGLCVAQLKLGELSLAEAACTQAIEHHKTVIGRIRQSNLLKAYAFNNRAIVRYINHDITGAQHDFSAALQLTKNDVILANLNLLNKTVAGFNNSDNTVLTTE